MIRLTSESRILLAIAPADFRAGIDGMSARCRQVLEQDPRSGSIFLFINRARTMVRALVYDGNGFWLMTKRLSAGTFRQWPSALGPVSPISAQQLTQLLQCEAHWQPVSMAHGVTDAHSITPMPVSSVHRSSLASASR